MGVSYDPGVFDRLFKFSWIYTFAWLPQRCNLTNKIIWLKKAYKGIEIRDRFGMDVYDMFIWHEEAAHIKYLLTK